jgi:DNA-binding response OmpR family regulator
VLISREHIVDLVEGLGAGGGDYFRKPFDAQELRAQLRIGGRILELERRLVRAVEDAEYKATPTIF